MLKSLIGLASLASVTRPTGLNTSPTLNAYPGLEISNSVTWNSDPGATV